MEERGTVSADTSFLIIPKTEIGEELEITFDNDCLDNKDFIIPKKEFSCSSQHSDDEYRNKPMALSRPIKKEILEEDEATDCTDTILDVPKRVTIQIEFKPESNVSEDCLQTLGPQFSDTYPQIQNAAKELRLNACSLCDYTCKFKSRLLLHMMTHTGEKPFSCDQCEKKFIKKHHLNDHRRTHTGEKPYSCALCQRNFIQKQHLSDHMRTHTGEKSFSCNICLTRFTKKCNLNSHMLTHTDEKPFSCTLCSKTFGQRRHLNSHMKTHAGYKRFYCEICEKKFTHKRSHMRIHFRKEPHESQTEAIVK